jgi:hypothetical protein
MGRNRNNPRDTERLMRQGQQAFRNELATRSEVTARRLAQAYDSTLQTLNPYLRALINVADSDAIGLTRDLYMNQTTRNLQNAMRESLDHFAILLNEQSGIMARNGIAVGRAYGIGSLQTVGGGISWNRPTVEAIQSLVNYVDSPAFRGVIDNFGEYYSNYVSNIILADASLGKSPLFTARHIRNVVQSMPIADANRITRTVQIYSARRGTQEIYKANRDNMEGWYWSSAKDRRTCPGCWGMHGTFHPVDELLNDHHLGRCAMIPAPRPIAGLTPLVPQEGEVYFRQLSESQQREILGPTKYQAWKNGEFQFSDLSRTYSDRVYGTMRREATLQELVGQARARELTHETQLGTTSRRSSSSTSRQTRQTRQPTQPRYNFRDQLRQDEDSIRGQAYETAIGYDRNGRRMFRIDGNENKVSIPTNQWEAIRGGTMTHNHPDVAVPPSLSDLTRAHQYNLSEMRAVGRIRNNPINYVVRPPAGGWNSINLSAMQDDYEALYESEFQGERKRWQSQNDGPISPEEVARINIRFQSKVMKELSSRYGFEYTTQTASARE